MAAKPPPLLAGLLAGTLESALGAYLGLDANQREGLAPLAGKTIALRLRPFNATVYFCPTETSIPVLAEFAGTPDVTLSGSLFAFARMGLHGTAQESLAAGAIAMAGDSDTARRFQALLERLEIDWEAHLAAYAGKGFASSLFGIIGAGKTWTRNAVDALRADLAEYWQEESRTLPTRSEAEAFLVAVDALRADRDRLEARIQRLENTLSTSSASPSPATP